VTVKMHVHNGAHHLTNAPDFVRCHVLFLRPHFVGLAG
jgi:hypothetical protein